MIPQLPGLNGFVAGEAVPVPPPPRLRLPGRINEAGWASSDIALAGSGRSAAQKAGLRYERKALLWLKDIFLNSLYLTPPLYWTDEHGPAYCYPDALLVHDSLICCIEVKLQHMPEAWWQLRKKYEPILRVIYPDRKILLLEVCRALDSATPFPEYYTHVEELPSFIKEAKDGELGVFQWKL